MSEDDVNRSRDSEIGALTELLATACQVMAETGLVEHVLGHVSVRTAHDELLVRCRGPEEAGLTYTTADDIRAIRMDGTGDLEDWTVPNELPIHTEIMRARPDVTAVVHAHPPLSSRRRSSTPRSYRSTAPTTYRALGWPPMASLRGHAPPSSPAPHSPTRWPGRSGTALGWSCAATA
jgi:hypothetical protein